MLSIPGDSIMQRFSLSSARISPFNVAMRCRLAAPVGAILILASAAAQAQNPGELADQVTVTVQSGRQFRGQVNARTTAKQLWLRAGSDTAYVLRPIDWGRVTEAEGAGQTWSAGDFKRVALAKIRGFGEDPFRDDPRPPSSKPTGGPPPKAPHPTDNPAAETVRAVDVAAELGHWSAGVEADGLLVSVTPKDATGWPTAVDGTLELSLLGQRFVPLLANADQFPELARWTQVVTAGDFTDGVAVYRLPFQALHPDFNVDLGSLGLVHARLAVPGQGVFEATTGATPIRQLNPVRDRLQQQIGQRYWPAERTDRGKTTPPAYFSAQPGSY